MLGQVGLDTRYFGAGLGAAVYKDVQQVMPALSLRFGRLDAWSLHLGLFDQPPLQSALCSAELLFRVESEVPLRLGLGARVNAPSMAILPTLRVDSFVGEGIWIGVRAGASAAEGTISWQAQLMLTLPLLRKPSANDVVVRAVGAVVSLGDGESVVEASLG